MEKSLQLTRESLNELQEYINEYFSKEESIRHSDNLLNIFKSLNANIILENLKNIKFNLDDNQI